MYLTKSETGHGIKFRHSPATLKSGSQPVLSSLALFFYVDKDKVIFFGEFEFENWRVIFHRRNQIDWQGGNFYC